MSCERGFGKKEFLHQIQRSHFYGNEYKENSGLPGHGFYAELKIFLSKDGE
jgi:hypothetical protein